MTNRSLESSVRARLFIYAKTTKQDFQRILTGYAKERLLYRLGQSAHVDQFWLKETTLFELWFSPPHWPTRDEDSPGQSSAPVLDKLQRTFQEIAAISDEDGVTFDAARIRVDEIRKAANYPGVRMHIPVPGDAEYPIKHPSNKTPLQHHAIARFPATSQSKPSSKSPLAALCLGTSRTGWFQDIRLLGRRGPRAGLAGRVAHIFGRTGYRARNPAQTQGYPVSSIADTRSGIKGTAYRSIVVLPLKLACLI